MLEIYIHMHSFDARLNSWSKKQDCSNLHIKHFHLTRKQSWP